MVQKKKKDPVAGVATEEKEVTEKVASVTDFAFKPIPVSAAKAERPFDGYPLKKIKIGEYEEDGKMVPLEIYSTYIVALNPTVPVRQDPANRKVKQKDGSFKQVFNYHSRVIRDYENRQNIIVKFDRPVTINGQEFMCAIVPSHNVRAQVCYKYDTTKQNPRVEVDEKYLFLDQGQASRLLRVFRQVISPILKIEKEASFIAGQSESGSGEETKPLTENEV